MPRRAWEPEAGKVVLGGCAARAFIDIGHVLPRVLAQFQLRDQIRPDQPGVLLQNRQHIDEAVTVLRGVRK